MEPSSLALIAIVVVWAAYLVPHWVRRRDQLTQNRTADRDSSRLRLLVPRRRARATVHRSGGPVLSSPRVVIDADGQPLFIPGERVPVTRSAEAVAARMDQRKAVAAQPLPGDQGIPTRVGPAATAEGLEAAVTSSRSAARRRGRVLGLLAVVLISTIGIALTATSAPGWLPVPVVALLVVHLLASRVAAVRSHEHLTVLAAQVRTAEVLAARPKYVPTRRRTAQAAEPAVAAVAPVRRQVAAGSETWSPVPVPPPTYTLKPAVHRAEPAPLNLPEPARPTRPTPAAAARGALPRRPEDVEQILELEAPYPVRRAVNE